MLIEADRMMTLKRMKKKRMTQIVRDAWSHSPASPRRPDDSDHAGRLVTQSRVPTATASRVLYHRLIMKMEHLIGLLSDVMVIGMNREADRERHCRRAYLPAASVTGAGLAGMVRRYRRSSTTLATTIANNSATIDEVCRFSE